jgi:hypothetical protein
MGESRRVGPEPSLVAGVERDGLKLFAENDNEDEGIE